MTDRDVASDEFLRRLPLPLAQLYRRAHNAKTPRDAHDFAFYFWEAAIKLLASASIASYTPGDAPEASIADAMKNLARPALGHWWELTRLIVPVLAERNVGNYSAVYAIMLGRARTDLPRSLELFAAINAALGHGGAKTTLRVADLIDRIIEYRNKTTGHGAPAARSAEFYRPLTDVLLSAAAELYGRCDVLGGRRLIYVSEVRPIRGSWLVERSELTGIVPWRIASLESPRGESDPPPLAPGVYLADSDNPDRVDGMTALHPLLAFDAETEIVLFMNCRRGQDRAEMLCYTTGQLSPSDPDQPPISHEPSEAKWIGEYELRSELGRGAMGVVYRAWQSSLQRDIALKAQPRIGDTKADARFRREIRALGRVDHPNLVKVYTSGTDGDQFYYTMELVEGAPLASVSDALTSVAGSTDADVPTWNQALDQACVAARAAEKPIDAKHEKTDMLEEIDRVPSPGPSRQSAGRRRNHVDQVVPLLRQVAEAAHALHEHGVVHRDIKPGNVLVNADGSKAILMDLGLAQLADDVEGRLTRTRQFVGTLRYASPEQVLAAGAIDRRADVYSLGATLWELLALRPLFDATESTPTPQLMLDIQNREPDRLSKVNPAIGRDLEAVVHKCLEKRPQDRYATAHDLADDLQRVSRGEPVIARPVGAVDRAWKWMKRRPVISGMSTALLLAIVAGTIASWVLAAWARQEASAAQAAEKREGERASEAEQARDAERAAKEQIAKALAIQSAILAQIKWRDGETLQAFELLYSIPENRRNWNWHYLRQTLEGSYATLYGHALGIRAVSFSPDNARVASASVDGTLRLWDAVTGKELAVLRGHSGPVTSLAFSPDGKLLASGSQDHDVRLWDGASGRELATLKGHKWGVEGVAFNHNGTRLASTANEGLVRLWDVAKRSEVAVLPCGPNNGVPTLAFSPDGSQIATAPGCIMIEDGTIHFWDAATGKHISELRGHTKSVGYLAYSPDGKQLASSGLDGTMRLWDLSEQHDRVIAKRSNTLPEKPIYSPDGRRLATLGLGSVHIFECASGKEITPTLTAAPAQLEFSPDGARFAVGMKSGEIALCDAETGQILKTFEGHLDRVLGLAFSADGALLVSGSLDRTIRFWETTRGLSHSVIHRRASKIAFGDGGQRFAAACYDGVARIWDAATSEEIRSFKNTTTASRLTGIAYSRDGAFLAVAQPPAPENPATVQIWHVGSGREGPLILGLAGGTIDSLAFSPDGSRLAIACQDAILICNVSDGDIITRLPVRDATGIAFSPDGKRLAISLKSYTIRLWDIRTAKMVCECFGHKMPVKAVTFSPDGTRLASGSDDKTVRIWDAASGKQLHILRGHTEGVNDVAYSPDGAIIASASKDTLIRLWDADSGQELSQLRRHSDVVSSIAFSRDGRRLVSASADDTIRIWEAMRVREIGRLRGHDDEVVQLAFSADGSRLTSRDNSNRRLVWDFASRQRIDAPPTALAEGDFDGRGVHSPDRKILALPRGQSIVLVDCSPPDGEETKYRKARAKPHPDWHLERAKDCEQQKDWFGARFHWDWMTKIDPKNQEYRKRRDQANSQLTKVK